MPFKPVEKMLESVETARSDSDVALFYQLMYLGELITKAIVASLVAMVGDDRDRHRYRQLHRLVRADSLGEWSAAMEDVLVGPAAQFLRPKAYDIQRQLTQEVGAGSWQYEAAKLVHQAATIADPSLEDLHAKVAGRRALTWFVTLRNSTRGHGAPAGDKCSRLCPLLEQALHLIVDNVAIFSIPWAYLHRNLSGKYRVTGLVSDSTAFDDFKRHPSVNLPDGVYLFLDEPIKVDLVDTTVDAIDFFFPNGRFTEKNFELISYITDTRRTADAGPYMAPATDLPASETEGLGLLEAQGLAFGNLPPLPERYVERHTLEEELYRVLIDDRHPVVTLAGRGGIGKTSVALRVLHRLTETERFGVICWFSGRDIDLLQEGPKLVRPQVVSREDIAKEFVQLMGPSERHEKGFGAVKYFQAALNDNESRVGPLLIVIDNYETVRGPGEVFTWLENSVRNPNKILITTRERDFKADFPVEVRGMSEDEADELMTATAGTLGVRELITPAYRQEVYREADGHPYVIKILLGEVAKAGRMVKVERIAASQERILDALFERTYASLSPVAKRVFLTLCNWSSALPKLAVEAVLLRPGQERLDVDGALEELRRSSFIDVRVSEKDHEAFVTVPLMAAIFGRRKLGVSELKTAVDADTELLQLFGAAQASDIKHGVGRRIERLFREVAGRIGRGQGELQEYIPILEVIAGQYSPAWLWLSELYEEVGTGDALADAKTAVRRYLEVGTGGDDLRAAAWQRLAELCGRSGDVLGEIHATVEHAVLPGTPFRTVSEAANRLNGILRRNLGVLDTYEKQVIVRRLLEVMRVRIDEADGDDCSRLGWLALHFGDAEQAEKFVSLGLRRDRDNEHCLRLARRLGIY